MVAIKTQMKQRLTEVRGGWNALSFTCPPVAGFRLGFGSAACSFTEQTAFREGDRGPSGPEYVDPRPLCPQHSLCLQSVLCDLPSQPVSSPLRAFNFTAMIGLVWFLFSGLICVPCPVSLSGAIKVTACGRTLTS